MAIVLTEPSRTFSEYLLVPGYSSADARPENVSLATRLLNSRKARSLRSRQIFHLFPQ